MSLYVRGTLRFLTDCAVPNTALNHGIGVRVHSDAARAVNYTVANYGLGEERKGRRSFVGQDCNSSRHGDKDFDRRLIRV